MKKHYFFKEKSTFRPLAKLLISITVFTMCQNNAVSQICGTSNITGSTSVMSKTSARTAKINGDEPIVINMYFNILNSGSTSTVTEQQCKDALVLLNNRYAPSHVVFRYNGYRNYYNNASATINSDNEFNQLRNINTNTASLQVFFVDGFNINGQTGIVGKAQLPGTFMALRKDARDTFVFAHEIGHNLNLFHTFHGQACEPDPNIPAELTNGTNCATAGDLVCDTPADPCMNQNNVNAACAYTGGGGFNPDTRNFMSYTTYACGNRFTNGQIDRLREALVLNNSLQTIQVAASQLAKPLKITSTRANYTRTPISGGCYEISYLETDKLEFQKGFNYTITVIHHPLNNTTTHNYTSAQTPLLNISSNSYNYTSKITTHTPNPTYSSSGNAGFVFYIDCPIYFPLMSANTTPVQSGEGSNIQPGLYLVPIHDEKKEEVIETPKVLIQND